MAIIYGTPAILWPKPDTSEEWLINSSVVSPNNKLMFSEEVNFTSNNEEFVQMSFYID